MTSVQTNTLSLRGLQNARRSESVLGLAIQRLSSGLRINSARDDAAGAAISNRMGSMIRGQATATRNANDGISMMATAEGALSSINDRLQRIRTLTVQGMSGSLNQGNRDAIQAEINLNLKEIDHITQQTQFNGRHLLDGSIGALNLQVGAFDGQTLNTDFGKPGYGVDALGLKDYTISGIAGDIHDISELPGRAINVMLAAPDTVVSYSLNGSSMSADTKLMRNGVGSYFVQTTEAGQTVHYLAGYQSNSTTATHTSQVEVTAQANASFKESNNVSGVVLGIGTTQYLDESGIPILSGGPTLVKADNPTDGNLYYLRMNQGGETFYYRATVTSTKARDGNNASDEVVVQIDGSSPRFSTQDYAAATGLSAALPAVAGRWQDAGGAQLDVANLQTIFDGDASLNSGHTFIDAHQTGLFQANDGLYYVGVEYLIEDTTTFVQSQEARYYAADIDISNPAGAAQVTIKANTATGLSFNPTNLTSLSATPTILPSDPGLVLSSADTGLSTLLAGGQTLVQGDSDHHYYLTDGVTYTAVDLATAVTQSNGTVALAISVNTQTAQPRLRAAFDTATSQNGQGIPGLAPAAPGSFDAGGKTFVKYDTDGIPGNDQYFLRELSGGNVKFYRATVQTQMASDGTLSLLGVTEDAVATYNISDVQKVTGDSLVSLSTPAPGNNVVVTYVDHTGKTYHDVLSVDQNGDYILDLPDYAGSGISRTSTLVQVDNLADHLISQDGDLLIKTLNGSGNVVIYYALGYSANLSVTDADDRDGNANYHTEIMISELGDEIRLRTPRYPLAALDQAMAIVDEKRSELGAIQNRLESVVNHLTTSNLQLSAAQSRIQDADYAVEVGSMTRAQILQQAAVTVLAQANQIPRTVLSLLQ